MKARKYSAPSLYSTQRLLTHTSAILLSVSALEGGGHGSLLCEFLGVQGFSEGWSLIGIGGYYGGAVWNGIRRGSNVAGSVVQVLPCEQGHVGAR